MGKLIGALLGFFTLNIFGAIIGFIAGHFFDKGRSQLNSRFSPEEKAKVETAFLKRFAFFNKGKMMALMWIAVFKSLILSATVTQILNVFFLFT